MRLFSRKSDDSEDKPPRGATIYRAPAYIQLAAKRKLNKDDIFVIGVTDEEIHEFRYSMQYHAVRVTRPQEKGRAIVAIESRCHANTAEIPVEKTFCGPSEDSSESKPPDDWFDQFTITNKKDKTRESTKSFQLQLSKSKTTSVGVTGNLQVTGAGYFNAVSASGGISGQFSKTWTKGKTETYDSGTTDILSQGYEVEDVLKIPPKTKVKATISTWAVTYESEVVTEVTVDAKAALNIRYRPGWSRRIFGGVFTKKVKVTAKEIFRDELDYECEDDVVTFKRVGAISHLGEEVEIIKERDPCSLEEELNRETAPV